MLSSGVQLIRYVKPVLYRSLASVAGRRCPDRQTRKSVLIKKRSPDANMTNQLITEDIDALNRPDPTSYCKNTDIKSSVSALEHWIDNMDIEQHRPSIRDSCNLASLVPNNVCLQKLVQLGADLLRMERQPGVANMLVKTDFDQTIAPKLWILSDIGFNLPQIARIVTYAPKIINLSNEELSSRFSYFKDRGFSSQSMVSVISQSPEILSLTSVEIDIFLRELMTIFHFEASEVREIVVGASQCILQPISHAKDVFVVLTKMIGFSVSTARNMVIKCPKLILTSHRVLSQNVIHLHKRLGISFEVISLFPKTLTASPRILVERTKFLLMCNLLQPDGSKPLYTPLDAVVTGGDEDFCQRFAKGKEDLYDDYLRTL